MRSPLKWHGGKSYLADRIVGLFPPRCRTPNKPDKKDKGYLHYVEPYAGGLSVLLANDPEGISEVVNDMSYYLTNLWSVIRDESVFQKFRHYMESMAVSFPDWDAAQDAMRYKGDDDNLRDAVAFFVCCRQSMSGRMKNFTPLTRNRTRRGMNAEASAWLSCIEGLPELHLRLRRVVVINGMAVKVIKQQDGKKTLFYLDPPYLHETRSTTGEYEHEMDKDDHKELLETLTEVKGRFLLSGYRSDLYDGYAELYGWNLHEFDLPNNAASGKKKRRMVECVWTNY